MLRIDPWLLRFGYIQGGGVPTGLTCRAPLMEISDGAALRFSAAPFKQRSADPQGDFQAVLLDSMDEAAIMRDTHETERNGPAPVSPGGAGDLWRGGGFPDGFIFPQADAARGGRAVAHGGPPFAHHESTPAVLDGVLRGTRWDDPGAFGQGQTAAYARPAAACGQGSEFYAGGPGESGRVTPDFSHLGLMPPRYGPPQTEFTMRGSDPGPTQLYPPPPPPFKPGRSKSYGDAMLNDAWGAAERREMGSFNTGPRTHGGDHPREFGEQSSKTPEILLEG